MTKRDIISAGDLSREELENLLELASRTKGKRNAQVLNGKTLGMLFFDRSLRTRVSFEVAAEQLGGHCINMFAEREMYDLEPDEQTVMDGTASEHVKDAARTLSRYVDALGIRQLSHQGEWQDDRKEKLIRAYATHATVPVINLESTMEHPCQAIGDVMTIQDNLLNLGGRKLTLAWTNSPEAKNLGPCHSVLLAASMLGMDITVAHPLGFELDEERMAEVQGYCDEAGTSLRVANDLEDGVKDAEVVYCRAWGSTKFWNDAEREAMVKRSLQSWIINANMMALTNNALFMHPLPVRRGVGVTDEVLDGPRSVIYDQAENRVYAQKALLSWLLG